jgi:hypothetical protein
MSDFEAKREFSHLPSLTTHLTAVRGKVRRLPQGVEKQRAELLATQIKERVPGDALEFQAALMAGECLPVRKAIEEHSPQVWATLQRRWELGDEEGDARVNDDGRKSECFSPSAKTTPIRASVPAGKRAGICSSLIFFRPIVDITY